MLEKGGPQVRAGGAQVPSRYLDEANPSPVGVAQVAALLAERDSMMRGL
jgi:hypothetical protein